MMITTRTEQERKKEAMRSEFMRRQLGEQVQYRRKGNLRGKLTAG